MVGTKDQVRTKLCTQMRKPKRTDGQPLCPTKHAWKQAGFTSPRIGREESQRKKERKKKEKAHHDKTQVHGLGVRYLKVHRLLPIPRRFPVPHGPWRPVRPELPACKTTRANQMDREQVRKLESKRRKREREKESKKPIKSG